MLRRGKGQSEVWGGREKGAHRKKSMGIQLRRQNMVRLDSAGLAHGRVQVWKELSERKAGRSERRQRALEEKEDVGVGEEKNGARGAALRAA